MFLYIHEVIQVSVKMENLYDSVSAGANGVGRISQTEDTCRLRGTNNKTANIRPSNYGRFSREYAEAVKTLALTQINLDDKLKYCSVPVYNRG